MSFEDRTRAQRKSHLQPRILRPSCGFLARVAGVWFTTLFCSTSFGQDLALTRSDPPGLRQSPTYSQVITVSGAHKQIMVGAQAGMQTDGTLAASVAEQAKIAFEKVKVALASEGASAEDIIELNIYVVDLQKIDTKPLFQLVRDFVPTGHKPALLVLGVTALPLPDIKIEISARAIVPLTAK